MRSFKCSCRNEVFFENTQCLSCGMELGWCPGCRAISVIVPSDSGLYQCGNPHCGKSLKKCHNYEVERVCNRCFLVEFGNNTPSALCDYCRFNDTIPDLSVPGNREKWARLESAKRRLLYTLDLLRLPYGSKEDHFNPPLSFDFKADILNKDQWWWAMGKEERVHTGHSNGKITINLREADAVEREKTRVQFQEAHRTVIGHFRHEIAHYYWQMLVQGRREAEFKAVFGDHENPDYTQAQARYYEQGPIANWWTRYISAYASMHPWEDFAETFAAYLDMVSVLDTAYHMGVGGGTDPIGMEFQSMVDGYVRLGVVLNEMNRSMGLVDLVPEILNSVIISKLKSVHDLIRAASSD